MRSLPFFFFALLVGAGSPLFGQIWVKNAQQKTGKKQPNFYEIQDAFYEYWETRASQSRKPGYKQFKRWEYYAGARLNARAEVNALGLWEAWLEFQALHGAPDQAKNAETWVPLGPKAPPLTTTAPGYRVDGGMGRVNAIAFHPTNPSILYIGAPAGGLWKSTNFGSSWTLMTNALPNLGISSIAVAPSSPNTIYAATGDGPASGYTAGTYSIGVIKSVDGGNTWAPTALSLNESDKKQVHEVVVHPTNPNFVMAGTSFGLYRSRDGGASWDTLFNSGIVWDVEVDATYPDWWYITGGYTGVFYSSNGGDTWTASAGLPPAQSDAFGRIELTMCPSDTRILYALYAIESQDSYNGGLYGIYGSADGGQNFSLLYTQNYQAGKPNLLGWYDGLAGAGEGDFSGQGFYDLEIQVHPSNCGTLYTGGVNIWKSSDSGSTWSNASFWLNGVPEFPYPYTHADQHIFRYHPGGSMYLGNDGGIWRYDGNSYTDLNNTLQIGMIYAHSSAQTRPDMVLCGAQDNGSYAYIGGIWQQMTGGDGMVPLIDWSDHNVLYTSLYSGQHMRSLDGGVSFQNIHRGGDGAWVTPLVQDPVTPTTLYRGAKTIQRSTDRGGTWSDISPVISGSPVHSLVIAPSDPKVIYTADIFLKQQNPIMARTTDGGVNWSALNNPGGITDIAVHPTEPLTVYITRAGYDAGSKVYRSTDGGINWSNISSGIPNIPVNTVVCDKGNAGDIYVGTDMGVYQSRAGASFTPYGNGISNIIVADLDIQYASRKLRGATYGRGLWEVPLPAASGGGGGNVTPDPNTRWLAHVTKIGGAFETVLTLTNNAQTAQTITLTPYTSTGTRGSNKSFNLGAYGFQSVRAQDAFPGFDISHFSISGSKDIVVTAGYRLADGSGATAHVNESQDVRKEFWIFTGEWSSVFDGMALVNLATSDASVTLQRIAPSGKVLEEKQATLPAYAKTLSVFGTEFNNQPTTMVKVVSSQPAAVVFLRGTYPGTSPGYLYQTAPLLNQAPSSGRWVSHVTPNTTFNTSLYFTNFGASSGTLTITPYNSSGTKLTTRTETLDAGYYHYLPTATFFGGEAVSHFSISGPSSMVVTVGYKISQGVGATAHVNETHLASGTSDRNFILYQGEWNKIFDGLAIVNTGSAAAKVLAAQFDAQGNRVGDTKTISASLPANGKALALFDSLFSSRPDLQIYIQSDQPSVLLMLRGTRPGVSPGYLYQTAPIPMHADQIFLKEGEGQRVLRQLFGEMELGATPSPQP
jgi:photosystem II stability/assembly factor-like uncharacterized protein